MLFQKNKLVTRKKTTDVLSTCINKFLCKGVLKTKIGNFKIFEKVLILLATVILQNLSSSSIYLNLLSFEIFFY